MIHTHSRLKDIFKVETTSTIDFNLDYVKDYPNLDKFPEFNRPMYSFMNSDGWF